MTGAAFLGGPFSLLQAVRSLIIVSSSTNILSFAVLFGPVVRARFYHRGSEYTEKVKIRHWWPRFPLCLCGSVVPCLCLSKSLIGMNSAEPFSNHHIVFGS